MKDQPTGRNDLGPWQALAILGVCLLMLLGFIWGFAAIFMSYL